MADDKKPAPSRNMGWEIAALLLVLWFLSLIYAQASYYVHVWGYGSVQGLWQTIASFFIRHFKTAFYILGIVSSALAIWAFVESAKRFRRLVAADEALYGQGPHVSVTVEGVVEPPSNPHWERIISHINSINPSEWRLAIIEADVMLDDLLKDKGFHGDTLGERLKGIDRSDMLSLDNAWESHKIRNQIAHQGADFSLSERDAKRTIALYESVFKEFRII